MDLHNRMKDVEKIECRAAQDLLRMLVSPGWQNKLYSVASDAKKYNKPFKDKYINAYEAMRNNGIQNYSIEDMDLTLISSIILYGFKFTPEITLATEETKKAIAMLRNNKNSVSHSGHNETQEELYLQSIIFLYHLKQFVKTVDEFEINISEIKRLHFRQEYISKIDKLITEIDEDRFELIYIKKSVENNVQQVLRSNDKSRAWLEMHSLYSDRYTHFRKFNNEIENEINEKLLHEFDILSSLSGIAEAHSFAIDHLLHRNPQDAIQHINQINPFTLDLAHSALCTIDLITTFHPDQRDNFLPVIHTIVEKGYIVEETEPNRFRLKQINKDN